MQTSPPAQTSLSLGGPMLTAFPRLADALQALGTRGFSPLVPSGPLAPDYKHNTSLRFSGCFREATGHEISSVLT